MRKSPTSIGDAGGYNAAMNTPAPTSRSLSTWLILFAAIAAALGLWLGNRYFAAPAPPKLANAVLYPQPRELPDFHLTRTDGKPLVRADWRGHWNVVYFGYTSCPDVCPTTLATFKDVWKALAKRDLTDKIRFDFISIDPQRDTPAVLGRYVGFFNPEFLAATGSDEELTGLTRALGLIYSRTTDANGAIEVDHSGSAVIIDPQARLIGMFRPPFNATAVTADLVALAGTRD
jgi:protein SCO1/2